MKSFTHWVFTGTNLKLQYIRLGLWKALYTGSVLGPDASLVTVHGTSHKSGYSTPGWHLEVARAGNRFIHWACKFRIIAQIQLISDYEQFKSFTEFLLNTLYIENGNLWFCTRISIIKYFVIQEEKILYLELFFCNSRSDPETIFRQIEASEVKSDKTNLIGDAIIL